MVYDALEMAFRTVKVRKDPECAVCGKNPTITELIDYEEFCGVVSEDAQKAAAGSTISATELKDLLEAHENIFLADDRERNEYETVSDPGARTPGGPAPQVPQAPLNGRSPGTGHHSHASRARGPRRVSGPRRADRPPPAGGRRRGGGGRLRPLLFAGLVVGLAGLTISAGA